MARLVHRLAALTLCLACVSSAVGQTIDPADYVPLSADSQWLLERVSGSGQERIRITVAGVNPVTGGTRYRLTAPFSDVTGQLRLEIGDDGTLSLVSLDADLSDLLDGVPFDPNLTATIPFTPAAILGVSGLVPGNAVTETPVDTDIEATIHTSLGSRDVTVGVTGRVTATWTPNAAVDTAAGAFDDVVRLSVDLPLDFTVDDFDVDTSRDERIDWVLARDVGFVQVEVEGTIYRLLRAIVDGRKIGDFPQQQDLLGVSFTTPPLLTIDGRAAPEAASGDVALHDVRLTHALSGQATLDGSLDLPLGTGIAVQLQGRGKARRNGTLAVRLRGSAFASGQKLRLRAHGIVDASSTSLALVVRGGGTDATVPIGIQPLVATTVQLSLDGLVDQTTGTGGTRRLSSGGTLRVGETAYVVETDETSRPRPSGIRRRVYRVRQDGSPRVVLTLKATSTSDTDLTTTLVKPVLFARRIPRASVTNLAVDLVPGG